MSSSQEPKTLKYGILVQYLRREIANGRLKPGSRAPSLSEMQMQFRVSRATVEKAYDLLEQEGVLWRRQGSGTFVVEQSTTSRSTGNLGLIMHTRSTKGFYILELLAGVREEAARQDLELLWLSNDELKSTSDVDAILMCCDPSEALALNISEQLPHALLFHHSPDFTCIAADNFTGGKLATQHLLELGHQRIACLPSSDYDSISRQRQAGHRAALAQRDVEFDEKLTCYLVERRLHGYRQSGEVTMKKWLQEDWAALNCTAILAHNDETAIGVIKALRDHGLQVPGDISVIGFDGTELSELCDPVLTTIKVPLRELGAAAVKVLAEQVKQGQAQEQRNILLPVQFKAGKSTAKVQAKAPFDVIWNDKE